MQLLTSIRESTNTVTDISFFINLDCPGQHYTEQEIAQIIKGVNYRKSVQQLEDFTDRCMATLREMQQGVEQKNEEYDSLVSQCRSNNPGSPPSSYVNREDPDAVRRHNERVNEFNNKVDLHRRLQDQANRVKERVEDALDKLNSKRQQFEEQIEEKKEKLKPALEQDIVAFLGNLQKLVQDNIRNKKYAFQPFVLIFMAKKAYMFFFELLDNSSNKNSANSIFRTLDDDLEKLIENHQTEIQQGLADVVDYLNDSYIDNKVLLDKINEQMSFLPYQECQENESKALELVSRSADTNFSYEHIIDPRELSVVETDVKERKFKFQHNIQNIESLNNSFAPSLKSISEIKTSCLGIQQNMINNKIEKIVSVFLIHSKISTFKPALTSQHSAYTDVKDDLSKKMQTFFYVNLAILILAGSASFAVDSTKKPWLYGLAASYLAPSAGLLLKKKELDSL